MFDISRRELRSTCGDYPRNLCIPYINRLPPSLSPGGQLGGRLGSRLIKVENTTLQIFNHQFLEGGFEGLPSLALGKQRHPKPRLKKRDAGNPDGVRRLAVQPLHDGSLRDLAHQR